MGIDCAFRCCWLHALQAQVTSGRQLRLLFRIMKVPVTVTLPQYVPETWCHVAQGTTEALILDEGRVNKFNKRFATMGAYGKVRGFVHMLIASEYAVALPLLLASFCSTLDPPFFLLILHAVLGGFPKECVTPSGQLLAGKTAGLCTHQLGAADMHACMHACTACR